MLTLKIILIMKTTTHMATNIPIQVIWNSLKSNKTYGLVKQLYNSNLSANIYAIYKYPENLRKRVRDAAFFLIIMLVTFAATL